MAQVNVKVQSKYDGKGLRKLRQDASRTAKKLKSEFGALANELGATLALGGLAIGVKNFAIESVVAADQARVTESAFIGLSGGAEQAAHNLAAMERATRGLISQQEQQAIANQLLGMEIVSTADDLEKVVSVSRRLGKEFRNLGADEAANEFAIMISNMSFQRLDSFGISSGNVRDRVQEMGKAAGRAANQQDFFTATMEQADRVLARLGPELETNADKVDRLASRYEDFKASFGDTLSSIGEAGGIIDGLTELMEQMTAGAKAWSFVIDQAKLLNTALDRMNESTDSAAESWQDAVANYLPFGQQIKTGVDLIEAYFFAGDELAETLEQVGREHEQAAQAQHQYNNAVEQGNQLTEEQIEHLERVAEIRRDFARDLIRIDENTQDRIEDTWDDFFEDEERAWKRHNKNVASIRKRHAKDLAKLDKDLSKDLSKVTKDENKKIEKLKAEAARKEKISRIDHLADERLFNFELRQLAAEGQGNAIRAALERRAIEEEIAKEKAAVEKQIADNKLQEDIQRVKDEANERRSELRENASEERQLREEELAERLAAEEENYQERLEELRQYREEKLVEIENSRKEAIAVLGRELAEAKELTQSELNDLVPIAAHLGEDVGKVFALGMNQGFETNQLIDQMLATIASSASPTSAGNPNNVTSFGVPGFQSGGIVPGPIGAPQLAVVHGGETITPAGRGAINFSPTINVSGGGSPDIAGEIIAALQEYTDTVLVPALS